MLIRTETVLSGESNPKKADSINTKRIIKDKTLYCCALMLDLITGGIFKYSETKGGEYVIHLACNINSYGDIIENEIPINFCPFCGGKISYENISTKTILVKTITNTTKVTNYEEVVIT